MSTAETQVDSQAPDGGEVVGVPSIGDAIGGLAAAFGQGRTVTREAAKLGGELVRVAIGRSEVEPGKGDRRFSDPAWSGNPIFSRIERGYLATAQAVSNVVGELGDGSENRRRAEQARFATTILTSALSPTNFLPRTRPRSSARSTPAARAWCAASATSSATCATTAACPRWSSAMRSRSARTSP